MHRMENSFSENCIKDFSFSKASPKQHKVFIHWVMMPHNLKLAWSFSPTSLPSLVLFNIKSVEFMHTCVDGYNNSIVNLRSHVIKVLTREKIYSNIVVIQRQARPDLEELVVNLSLLFSFSLHLAARKISPVFFIHNFSSVEQKKSSLLKYHSG